MGRFLDVFEMTDKGWRFIADHASYLAPDQPVAPE